MERMRWNDIWPRKGQPVVVALGCFDGLHQGHRALMRHTEELAASCGARPVMISFEPHPTRVLKELTPVRLIYGLEEKEWVLTEKEKQWSLVLLHFEPALSNMEPEEFVRIILWQNFGAAGVVIGENFRFGKGNQGNAQTMRRLCAELGIQCEIVPQVEDEKGRISSTRVRKCLENGQMEEANRLLSRPYFMLGSVSHGRGIGHKALIPTVNLMLSEERQYPAGGVYVTRTYTEQGVYQSVSNIGHNPTVGEGISLRCETYLLDCSADLYGQKVRVEFYRHLRPEYRFTSMEELHEQQMLDIQNVRAYFAEEKGNES